MVARYGGYNLEEKNHYGFSHHDLRPDRVVTKVEKSVNIIIGHRQQTQRQVGSREEGKAKEKYTTTMKIPKWKHYESENKSSQKENMNEQPTMIVSGGWVRPNRAMWASPPNSSSFKPQNSN
ncbi:hypothetical protein CARUB_v10021155mg [Capsella rubella]|uniref:Uncharacterized protein n=1 Tax=Capsella rubella TaxID=81985 RepID=R0ICK1_9BRAS|nr:uncharacterized protein LOC17895984 [Capsella rubella]EOA35900.1 hypothetical protein CARUB_v10021155mg [Capsella rubella]